MGQSDQGAKAQGADVSSETTPHSTVSCFSGVQPFRFAEARWGM